MTKKIKLIGDIDSRNKLNELTGKEWIKETKSVWFQKGLGNGHPHTYYERQHPAPFSYQDVQRLIEFFTKTDQIVLDPFVGVSSTLKACALSKRYGIGIDLSNKWNKLGEQRLMDEVGIEAFKTQQLITGDSREVLKKIPDDYFHFAVTSPPYWNILTKKADHKVISERLANGLSTKYSNNKTDLGNLPTYREFIEELSIVFNECIRVIKKGKYFAIIVSDFRHKNEFISFHSDLINQLTIKNNIIKAPLELHGIKVLIQNNKKLYPYGYPYSYVENIHHQYILIFRVAPI